MFFVGTHPNKRDGDSRTDHRKTDRTSNASSCESLTNMLAIVPRRNGTRILGFHFQRVPLLLRCSLGMENKSNACSNGQYFGRREFRPLHVDSLMSCGVELWYRVVVSCNEREEGKEYQSLARLFIAIEIRTPLFQE